MQDTWREVTTADAGFMTTDVMVKRIAHFAQSVPTPLRRPVGLVLGGAGSHMDTSIDRAAAKHGVVLIQLPAYDSHLFQSLDAAEFKVVKAALKNEIYDYMITTGESSISKKDVIMLTSTIWTKGLKKARISLPGSQKLVYGR